MNGVLRRMGLCNVNKKLFDKANTVLFNNQVTYKRLMIPQKKIVNQEDFTEKRGTHTNRRIIATEEMRILIYAHLMSIPNKKSTHSHFKYFKNPILTVKKLYFLFACSIGGRKTRHVR